MSDKYRGFCKVCGDEFYKNSGNQIYCSKDCRLEDYGMSKKSPRNKDCEECGEGFLWVPTKPAQKYCSEHCSQKANLRNIRKHSQEKRNSMDDALKLDVETKVSELFKRARETKPSELSGVVIDYNKLGGFTDAIKRTIKERDDYTCQICGNSNNNLEVHHILKRVFGGDHSENNLITLCIPCHRAVETGDENYAKRKCFINSMKVTREGSGEDSLLTDQQIINSFYYVLNEVFTSISQSSSADEYTESLISIANILEAVE